jgi:ribokinase
MAGALAFPNAYPHGQGPIIPPHVEDRCGSIAECCASHVSPIAPTMPVGGTSCRALLKPPARRIASAESRLLGAIRIGYVVASRHGDCMPGVDMTPRNTVLVAGSANLDFVVRAPRIPAPGETVLGGDFRTFPGGKGANQAVACARAGGARTRMLVALGADAFADPLEESLRSAGVDTRIVRVDDAATGVAFICLSADAENAITVAPGANARLRATDLPELSDVSHLLLQLESPLDAVLAWARAAHDAGVTVVLNAAPARLLPAELLAAVDVLIVNEGELRAVAGEGGIAAAIARLGGISVIVTLGARGSCAYARGEWLLQPAFEVDAIDTTGAGDTFCGVFVAASAQGHGFAEALQRAAAASALACTRLGAQAAVPDRAEVDALLVEGRPRSLDALRRHCGLE